MKQFVSYLITLFLLSSSGIFADNACDGPDCPHPKQAEAYYIDEEDDEFFNQGKIVGEESKDYLRAYKRRRNTNWAIALGTTAIGITTLVLVGKNQ